MGGRGISFRKFAKMLSDSAIATNRGLRTWNRAPAGTSRGAGGGGGGGSTTQQQASTAKAETPRKGRVREPALQFTGKASVTISAGERSAFAAKIGRANLTDKDIIKMFGVPNGGRIRIDQNQRSNKFEVSISHPAAQSIRLSVFSDAKGRLTLNGDMARKSGTVKPTAGLEMVRNLVSGISSFGFKRFSISHAAGSKITKGEWTGYKTWVRMGFNGAISRVQQRQIRNELGIKARTIQELFQKGGKKGEDWWRDNGRGGSVRFDLRAGSTSRKRLNEQINFFNIRGLENV